MTGGGGVGGVGVGSGSLGVSLVGPGRGSGSRGFGWCLDAGEGAHWKKNIFLILFLKTYFIRNYPWNNMLKFIFLQVLYSFLNL